MSGLNTIRTGFLNYFSRHGHEVIPSAPLVPHNDPTLLFTNAGMVPFKNVFTGMESCPHPKVVSAQKCVRAGGKHNDLDSVGRTARHHTFFEMLGNFAFSAYFKDTAIELAWNLITREFSIPPHRLCVSVHVDDDDAVAAWKKIAGLPESRIVRIAGSDNFWTMGDTGPCGPCSEIFFDHGEHIPGGIPGTPEQEGDRFVEIWNLVFMQFEQMKTGEFVSLERPSIDTGMGLERIAAVLQGTHDNYEIDLFRALIDCSAGLTGVPAEGEHAISHRVIADHLRACGFLIADGITPSNEGRGYVLRRIMRRAMRHVHMLGMDELLMWRLVPTLVEQMGSAYPELCRAQTLVTDVLRAEEERFHGTLRRGLSILQSEAASLNPGDVMAGEVAFRLYDTYGFPLDLTEDILKTQGIGVAKSGFDRAMLAQREMARKSWAGSGEDRVKQLWFDLRTRNGKTDFRGYETTISQGTVLSLIRNGQEVSSLGKGEGGYAVFDQTPFYGESGGQVGDQGQIFSDDVEAIVEDTQCESGDVFVHRVTVTHGGLKLGQLLNLQVNDERRTAISRHHSAVHLLHKALHLVLGDHAVQKGSLVEPHRLRFDFNHTGSLPPDVLSEVEGIVNAAILCNEDVSTLPMSLHDAKVAGAMALFGEKYPDEVRVVSIGSPANECEPKRRFHSIELCGGTHVHRTGDIGLFMIVSEGSVAAGVRRIEAVAGSAAHERMSEHDRVLKESCRILKVKPSALGARIRSLEEECRELRKEVAALRRAALLGSGKMACDQDFRQCGSVKFVSRIVEGMSIRELRSALDIGRNSLDSGILAFINISEDGGAVLVIGVTEDLLGRFDAVDLVRIGAADLGGQGGGGQPGMAQSGGPNGANAKAALDRLSAEIEKISALPGSRS